MIRQISRNELPVCVDVIRKSFMTVAEELGFTAEIAPRFTAFATTEDRLFWQMDNESRLMFLYEERGIPCGYYSLLLKGDGECELNNLAVLPEYRHNGVGKQLLEHSYQTASEEGCKLIDIGIVEENQRLRRWYEENGAVHVCTKKFDFFPFTCGYLKKEI